MSAKKLKLATTETRRKPRNFGYYSGKKYDGGNIKLIERTLMDITLQRIVV